MPSAEALVDAVVELHEVLIAAFQAARNNVSAKQDTAISKTKNTVANGEANTWCFHEERYFATMHLAIP